MAYDICAMRVSDRNSPVGLSLVQGGGLVCTGLQKLIQTWLIEFLTRAGSVAKQPVRGTDFLASIQNGAAQSVADVQAAFSLAADHVRGYLMGVQGHLPNDEQLDSAVLENVTVDYAGVSLTVRLTSKSGESRTFVAPVRVAPVSAEAL